MTGLEDARVQRLLESKEIAVLATVQGDRAPLATPMWFLHERFHQKYSRLQHLWKGHAMPPDRVMFRIVPVRARSGGL